MACGNRDVGRSRLASQPTPVWSKFVTRQMAEVIVKGVAFGALETMPSAPLDIFVDETGTANLRSADGDKDRHVHVKYHYGPEGGDRFTATGIVMVQVTDRTVDQQFGELHGIDRDKKGKSKGHHESTLFLRTPSPEQVDRAVQEAVSILRSRRASG